MGKKKSSKSVLITVIVMLVVLACLTFVGIRYLLPYYSQEMTGSDIQYEIYRFAVRLFPLLVGIVLIVIASIIATSREEEQDDEDLLPPNSYDSQLFEDPADDPVRTQAKAAAPKAAPAKAKGDELTISDEDFFEIFGEGEEKPEEEKAPEIEPVVEEEVSAEPEEEIAPAAAPAAQGNDKLIDAIYALVNKLDDMTDAMTYEEDDYVEEEEPQSVSSAQYDALERKIDRLCDVVANLSEIVSGRVMAAPAPAPAPAKEKKEKKSAPAPEPIVKTVVQKVEVPEDRVINDYDVKDPVTLLRIEFESAQDGLYDITYAFTKKAEKDVRKALGEVADVHTVGSKSVIVLPFLTKEEAEDEINRGGFDYDSVTVAAGEKADFDKVVLPRLK